MFYCLVLGSAVAVAAVVTAVVGAVAGDVAAAIAGAVAGTVALAICADVPGVAIALLVLDDNDTAAAFAAAFNV